ncbi:MAG: hypothetical protein EOO77_35620, partial [Oxalobacteraceae bacterium]
MHHYFEAITNTSGDSLIGYFGQVIDPTTNNVVPIAADDNGTPIVTVSGVTNMAKTDAYGNLDFYVAPGTYHLNIYAPNGTSLQLQVKNVAMNSTKGDTGAPGLQGDPGPAGQGLADVMAPTGASKVGFTQSGTGAVTRDGLVKLRERVTLRDFGVDTTGSTDAGPALRAAMAAGLQVEGVQGDVYLLTSSSTVPAGRKLAGNGATFKIQYTGIDGAINFANDRCSIDNWIIQGTTGGGFAVLNSGKYNSFTNNVCMGDIGHYFFFINARKVQATGNRVLGLTANTEITTAICGQDSNDIDISSNVFDDVLTGWSVQLRNCQNFGVTKNTIYQKQYTDSKTATAGQTVFTYNLGQKVLIDTVNSQAKVRVQI